MYQKSIYLAEQGGRSRPGLKKWVSGRLSPSALSQLGMRVLHHPTRSATSAGHTRGKEQWGVVHPASVFLVARPGRLWLHLTHQLHMNKEEAPWWLLLIKVVTTVNNIQESVLSFAHCKVTMKLNICSGLTLLGLNYCEVSLCAPASKGKPFV